MTVSVLGSSRRVSVPRGGAVTFGRGSDVDLPLGEHPSLSKLAGTLRHEADGVLVEAHQQREAGWLDVVVHGGHPAAHLAAGNTYRLPDPMFVVRINVHGLPLLLQVHRGAPDAGLLDERAMQQLADRDRIAQEQADRAGVRAEPVTSKVWTAQALLNPSRQDRWRTVAAIGCARAALNAARHPHAYGWAEAVPTREVLLRSCQDFFTGERITGRWLTNRLDEAVVHLGLRDSAEDKLPRIIRGLLGAQVVRPDVLRALQDRLWPDS